MISVIISTRNRPWLIVKSLGSILANSWSDFQIVVVDQSDNPTTRKLIKKIVHKRIFYFQMNQRGKPKGLNFGLEKARGDIFAFTDDDCLVKKDWLKNIYQSFQKNKDVVGVFGRVLPYRPEKHKGKVCPCTFLNQKEKIIKKPCLHWKQIGFGNNMAFKREIFKKAGYFKKWLGLGPTGPAGEDAEFALRLLLKGYRLLYNPKIVVYHNRWLTRQEYQKQCLSYSCGEVACYGYFAFQGKKFAQKVVLNNFKDSYWDLRSALKSFLLAKKGSWKIFYQSLEKLFSRFHGLLIGLYFSMFQNTPGVSADFTPGVKKSRALTKRVET